MEVRCVGVYRRGKYNSRLMFHKDGTMQFYTRMFPNDDAAAYAVRGSYDVDGLQPATITEIRHAPDIVGRYLGVL